MNSISVDQWGELMRAIGRLEATQNATLSVASSQSERLDSHAKRIGALERGRAWVVGAAAASAALIQFLPLPKL